MIPGFQTQSLEFWDVCFFSGLVFLIILHILYWFHTFLQQHFLVCLVYFLPPCVFVTTINNVLQILCSVSVNMCEDVSVAQLFSPTQNKSIYRTKQASSYLGLSLFLSLSLLPQHWWGTTSKSGWLSWFLGVCDIQFLLHTINQSQKLVKNQLVFSVYLKKKINPFMHEL